MRNTKPMGPNSASSAWNDDLWLRMTRGQLAWNVRAFVGELWQSAGGTADLCSNCDTTARKRWFFAIGTAFAFL